MGPAPPEGRAAALVTRLLELAVEELALIERLRIRLGPGFTVITGETGAGKSLLIDALGLVLGVRADPGLVRAGAVAARVEALFEVPDRDEPLICVREVAAAGRSLARLDDETVTAARLAATTGPLVAIHGQHQQQRLLDGAAQRDLLDAYGGHAGLRAAVAAAFGAWQDNRAALAALIDDPAELERRIALAEHAADEIAAAGVRPDEVRELRAALARGAQAGSIDRLVASVGSRLSEERSGARDSLAMAAREAQELARLDPRFAPLSERIEGLAAEVEDVAADLRRAGEADAAGPVEAALEERLSLLYGLLRKYGPDEAAVVAHGDAARAEARRLRETEALRAARLADDARLVRAADAAAAQLGEARQVAGARLGRAASTALAALGLRQAHLSVALVATELGPNGADSVAFELAANPGEPARPLADIASGGELSRVSLAIESVLAGADATPTLVFDEIDAGIGARSADPVGQALGRLAAEHQVVVVTHLAQIAAHADHHLLIEKQVEAGRTVTRLRALEGEERVRELAVMLGGSASRTAGPSAAAIATARELLERARLGSVATARGTS
ncbi:MAG: DNA repair protein RecN [Chloroflexota bacterium]|nr:MAG: DNA repair protein RecN [Chloroflexota bacterium]